MSNPWRCPGCGTYYGPSVQSCSCGVHQGSINITWPNTWPITTPVVCEHVWRKNDTTTGGWTCQKCYEWAPEVGTGK